jgi:hypothetical protein
MDQPSLADAHALGLGAQRQHGADDLVAHREGQPDPPVRHAQPLAAAEIEVPIVQVQICVADAARVDRDEDLGALRPRVVVAAQLEGPAPVDDLHAAHGAGSARGVGQSDGVADAAGT